MLDCSTVVYDYEKARKGLTFSFGDSGLESDGVVRFTIVEARSGDKWQDTSLAEIELTGVYN